VQEIKVLSAHFDANLLHIKYSILLKNTGRLPAMFVYPHVVAWDTSQKPCNTGDELPKLRERARSDVAKTLGMIYFANEQKPQELSLTVVPNEVTNPSVPMCVVIFGLVDYGVTFDNTRHSTGFNGILQCDGGMQIPRGQGGVAAGRLRVSLYGLDWAD